MCFLPLRGPSSVASWPKQSISAPFIRSSAPIVIAHSPSLSLPFIACACSPSLRRCLAPLKFAHNRARSLGSSFPFGTLRCVASHSGTSLISPQVSLPFESPLIWPLSPLRAKGLDGRRIHARTHTHTDRQTDQTDLSVVWLLVRQTSTPNPPHQAEATETTMTGNNLPQDAQQQQHNSSIVQPAAGKLPRPASQLVDSHNVSRR